ncbi:hypothetical protein PSHT_11479 [Puccinia striiformis]|uniref:Protein-synthesizing GTPase n=1 Tax=Puccinia striiformis TaxID=27350 RepID=A0A2S4V316_9BASI|nr:hypothetical protein PSHT_11479 [Puccinia striiformis]
MGDMNKNDPLDLSDSEGSSTHSDQIIEPTKPKSTNKNSKLNNEPATKAVVEHVNIEDIKEIKLDTSQLNPLSPQVISKQATINIGTIGHVAHGKSTVVKAISGVHTVRFKNELERNITIKLGYANAKIYKCEESSCARPGCYRSYGSDKEDRPMCDIAGCHGRMKLVRHVSFVDCPGHDILMATITLAAIEIMKLKHIIVLQNKVDLITETAASEQYKSILSFVKGELYIRTLKKFKKQVLIFPFGGLGTVADSAPVVPISAQLRYIDSVNEYIVKKIPVPMRDFSADPRLTVIRSFDVNKPGAEVDELKGGVAGGSLLQGVLRMGQEVEVRPGVVTKDSEGKIHCKPIRSKIVTLLAEKNELLFAVPGGLIGVGTKIDPQLCRADRLVGQVLGAVGKLPKIFTEIEINYFLLRRLLGVKTDDKKQTKVSKLTKGEILMVNIGSTSTGGRVMSVKADLAKVLLNQPACTEVGEKVALSRRIEQHWRLIGWGSVRRGAEYEIHS